MQWHDEIEARLADPNCRVMCLDPTGGKVAALPTELGRYADQQHRTSGPLEVFASEVRGDIVKAFVIARSRGVSTTEAPVRSGERKRFDFYNEVDALGCYVVTMGPPTGSKDSTEVEADELRVRATFYDLDVVGNIVDAHPDFSKMLGWPLDEIVGRSSLDLIHPDDHEKGIVGWITLLDEGLGARSRMRQRFLTKDGSWLWLEDTTTNLLDDPERACIRAEIIDISDEMAALEEAERREALLSRLTDALPTGVLHLNTKRLPIFWNQQWLELLGDVPPTLESLLEQVKEDEVVAEAVRRSFTEGADADIDVTLSGDARYAKIHLRALTHTDGTAEVLITLEDTTAAREYQQDLHDLSHRDSLTGLLSRLGLRPVVDDLLAAPSGTHALLFVDLDTFKPINDTFGHATGDAVLRAVAKGIASVVREQDSVARIGGDEFIVAVKDAASTDEIQEIVTRVHAALQAAEGTIDQSVTIRASIGAAEVLPNDTFDSLLRRADQAMYAVKRTRNAVNLLPETLLPQGPQTPQSA